MKVEPQCIRDLRWVLESPSLLDGANVVSSITPNLSEIDAGELQSFLMSGASHRVGRYFENLIRFWLTHIRKVDLIAHGQQIKDENRTVGEIDFLFRDESGRLTHCEAAVKFFLHFPRDGSSDYPGPNATDNFERKVAKLFDKQLRLSEKYFPDVEVRSAFVRGMIFYHPSVGEPAHCPERLSCSHLRGKWVRSSELSRLREFDSCRAMTLNKPYWLSPSDEDQYVSIDELNAELEEHFRSSSFPVMVSLLAASGVEECRMFVVSESWPASS